MIRQEKYQECKLSIKYKCKLMCTFHLLIFSYFYVTFMWHIYVRKYDVIGFLKN